MKHNREHQGEKSGGIRFDWQMVIAMACVILGVMVAVQFRSQKKEGFPFFSERSELIKMVRNLETERNKMQAELQDARKRLDDYVEAASKGETALASLEDELNKLRMQAGIVKVGGPGLIVRLNDSPKKPQEKEDPYLFLIHDVDLQAVVNELWASGAEAVSINGQRIIASTSIRCAGPIIMINSVRVAPPYEVRAVGPSVAMETALRMRGGFMDSMMPYLQRGVEAKIVRKENLVIPEYKGTLFFRYAKPVKGDEE